MWPAHLQGSRGLRNDLSLFYVWYASLQEHPAVFIDVIERKIKNPTAFFNHMAAQGII